MESRKVMHAFGSCCEITDLDLHAGEVNTPKALEMCCPVQQS